MTNLFLFILRAHKLMHILLTKYWWTSTAVNYFKRLLNGFVFILSWKVFFVFSCLFRYNFLVEFELVSQMYLTFWSSFVIEMLHALEIIICQSPVWHRRRRCCCQKRLNFFASSRWYVHVINKSSSLLGQYLKESFLM